MSNVFDRSKQAHGVPASGNAPSGERGIAMVSSLSASIDMMQLRAQQQLQTDRPKRPLTSYNLFFQAKRRDILKAYNDNDNKKVGFAGLARLVSAQWKVAPLEEKQIYGQLAVQDRRRYDNEMVAWKHHERSVKKNRITTSKNTKTNKAKKACIIDHTTATTGSITLSTKHNLPKTEKKQDFLSHEVDKDVKLIPRLPVSTTKCPCPRRASGVTPNPLTRVISVSPCAALLPERAVKAPSINCTSNAVPLSHLTAATYGVTNSQVVPKQAFCSRSWISSDLDTYQMITECLDMIDDDQVPAPSNTRRIPVFGSSNSSTNLWISQDPDEQQEELLPNAVFGSGADALLRKHHSCLTFQGLARQMGERCADDFVHLFFGSAIRQ